METHSPKVWQGMWSHFTLALSFLSVFNLRFGSSKNVTPADLAQSFAFFPLVGLLLGGCILSLSYVLHDRMPSLLLSVWATAMMTILTRGLHLDGLADLADGLGGGYTPERRLQIMKDSCSGAFGVLALVLAVALKVASIYVLVENRQWPPFLLIPMLSRTSMVCAAYKMPYARVEGGLGKPFLENMTRGSLYSAGILSLALSAVLDLRFFWLYAGLMLANVIVFRRLSYRCLGGITGDVLGAVNETTEVFLFSLAACIVE